MRILSLLVVLAPALAGAKPHPRDKARHEAAGTPAARAQSTRPAVTQAEDDEKPGSRTVKK